MTAPDSLTQLVEKFERDISRFQQPDYNEAQLREAFVNPFFRALGWDLGEQVLHEAGLRSGGTIKHPDYTFLAGNRRAFYVETKKPSIDIGASVEPAEQLRSYGWSGDTALGILTNFAEFAVYDCRIKPEQGDSPEEARVLYLTHGQYLDQWERLRAALSPEAVRQGAHRDLLEAEAKGVLRVDEAFLRDMESWRADLAEHLHKQARFIDRRLDQRELNHLVQRTIDRIVFLRIAEDRNLESYGRLERAAEVRRGVYNQIKTLYLAADKRYNSGLFHFDPADKSRPDADTLSLEIYIVDSVLRRIIRDLYPPKSRYQFSVISADILGQVYERFLGKVIEARSDGETTVVTVEEKPEARKAGGVYYTPGYIVDYIVENTVGALLRDKSPEEAARLRVLDPACGSGSFLTGAYQYLLDWHLKQYSKAPARWKNRVRHSPDGALLRIEEKRRILLNNIYGVDLDQNAVEVSKLALLLKMLENEGEPAGIDELAEPLLPDLRGNIKWGNSLIGSDFFAGAELADRDDEELYRVMPFDWAGGAGFGAIMRSGGFDAVIGNPPYVRQETLGKDFKAYAKRHYETYAGTADLYTFFIERGVKLLNENGLFGIIVANKWMRARYGKPLRTWLKKQAIREIIDFGDLPVFQQATTYPCILTIGKAPHPQTHFAAAQIDTLEFSSLREHVETLRYAVDKTLLDDGGWSLARREVQALTRKLFDAGMPLEEYANGKIHYGIKTGRNSAFIIDAATKLKLIEQDSSSAEIIKPFLMGRDIYRYQEPDVDRYVIFTRRGVDINDYPAIKTYLEQYRDILEPKPRGWIGAWKGRKPGSYAWYEIQDAVDYYEEFENDKIIVPCIVKSASYFLDNQGLYSNDKTTIIVSDDLYLYGLLNSKVLDFVMHQIASTKQGGYYEYKPMYLAQLPIRTIDFDNPADVAMHDDMVALVDEMLGLHRQLAGASAVKRGVLEALIERTDRAIDGLVYELYGLRRDEVGVVGGG
ncbi:MAG: Eco57I restriction-modification methylase domain-containing protein [Chloroflexota bacterium]|nr:Eco57I restriction-modification methylase domain-containing protein [Chloroflexota bacterium]MDE2909013.1 Eco57I restriction-modification methylase domain-containing protein [Chloroflexota bacterium]